MTKTKEHPTLRKLLEARTSTRSYTNKKIPFKTIQTLVDQANLAPSSCNLQLTQYIYVQDTNKLKQIEKYCTGKAKWAPQLLVVLNNKEVSAEHHADYVGGGMQIMSLMLLAQEKNIATCPIAGFDYPEKLQKILNIPKNLKPYLLIAIGEKNKHVPHPHREHGKNLVSFNSFSNKLTFPKSAYLKDWESKQIQEYRRRIFGVYFPREHHTLYRREIPKITFDLPQKEKILYIQPWETTLLRKYNMDGIDENKEYLEFLKSKKLIEKDIPFTKEAKPSYNHALIFTTQMFEKNKDQLFDVASKYLKKNGKLYVYNVKPFGIWGIVLKMLRLCNIASEVHNKSPYYRAGPFDLIGKKKLTKIAEKHNLKLVQQKNIKGHILISKIPKLEKVATILENIFPEMEKLTFKKT